MDTSPSLEGGPCIAILDPLERVYYWERNRWSPFSVGLQLSCLLKGPLVALNLTCL